MVGLPVVGLAGFSLSGRGVSWLTNSCQLVISWLGISVSCGGANYPTIFHVWVSSLVGRLVWYGARISRHLQVVLPLAKYHAASTHREIFCNSWRANQSPSTMSLSLVCIYVQCLVDDMHVPLARLFERCSPLAACLCSEDHEAQK